LIQSKRRCLFVGAVLSGLLLLGGCGSSVAPASDEGVPRDHGGLRVGVAKGLLRVPVGVPLGGYLRPPVGGEYLEELEAFASADFLPFFREFLSFLPAQADDGSPLLMLPEELRVLHSPYATISPPSRGYHDSLTAKAVALHNDGQWLVLVKVDTIAMLDELVQAVADEVQHRTGLALHDSLVMTATHTHDGPGTLANHSARYFWLAMDLYQPAVFRAMVDSIADVVEQATRPEALVPARFGYGFAREHYQDPFQGEKHLNSFRRDRLQSYDIDANNALRERLGVMRIDHANGAPLAVIINYAAHGIAFDVENQYFSADVLGAAERAVEQSFEQPVLAMLVQAASGDVSPRGDARPALQRIERFGALLAPQVRAIHDGIVDFDDAPVLGLATQRLKLNRETLGYSGAEYPYPWGAAQCYALPIALCLPAIPPDPLDLLDNGVGENGAFVPQDTRVSVGRIGRARLLIQPGEPLTEYGLRLLARAEQEGHARDDTFIWGYAQDHVGYILAPEEADWAMGGTEGTTTFWGWKLGARLLDATTDLLRGLDGVAELPADEFQIRYQPSPLPELPALAVPGLNPGTVVHQPHDIERFQSTTFSWQGGDPVVDLPQATLLRCDEQGESCVPARRRNGEIIDMRLGYRLINLQHVWQLSFEAPRDWPAGQYRFEVQGQAQQLPTAPYRLRSAAFAVTPSPSLLLSAPQRVEDRVEVTLAYSPRPDNVRLIDPMVPGDRPAPVRDGSVAFVTPGGAVLRASQPRIELRDEQLLAVYSIAWTGAVDTLSISGEDRYGNHSP
jgi:neutral ceramidase